MSLASKLLSAGGGVDKLFSDSVFSAYTYTGNGGTQTINNGIDLAGKGGMVWTKSRSSATTHRIFDTTGRAGILATDTGNGQNDVGAYPTHVYGLSNGYMASSVIASMNAASETYVSWTFRKAPKFFDIVTYTGDGVAGRQIPHALGIAPGMVVVKATSSTGDWYVRYRTWNDTTYALLNSTAAIAGLAGIWGGANTETTFAVGGSASTNISGVTYVAYLFAHDPSAEGIIQCGSFTTDASGNATVNLGWEPQYLMVKSSNGAGTAWCIVDASRGLSVSGMKTLYANTARDEFADSGFVPTATGFSFLWTGSTTFIYLAIRRPNKPPTTGTQVYNAIAYTGNDSGAIRSIVGTGFAPDLLVQGSRNQPLAYARKFYDRLRGSPQLLVTTATDAESSDAGQVASFNMDGFTAGASGSLNNSTCNYINHFFKRAPGFMDVVAYTGTGSATTIAHGLGVAPELIIVKGRSVAASWAVGSAHTGWSNHMALQTTNESRAASSIFNSTGPTTSAFTVGTAAFTNDTAATYVAYLFATLAGISKVGSYTGNGTTQTIPCGFTTGARFILIKKTSGTGDWLVADFARGIVSAGDPRLSLNTTAAEITGEDWLDPDVSGFIVNQTTADANASGASYIFLTVA